uniref:Thioredoxin-like protein 1 n=1 Tax=Timema monikensis TaxID=170555 RepID=A0A7R9E119_9NEOP|nr:unnamed protein product [Timema monikensis]
MLQAVFQQLAQIHLSQHEALKSQKANATALQQLRESQLNQREARGDIAIDLQQLQDSFLQLKESLKIRFKEFKEADIADATQLQECGPCQRIAPHFEQFARKYPRACFLKVDVDKCQETAANQGVSAMPTFIFYRNKTKIDRIQGANHEALESKIQQYYGSEEEDDGDSAVHGHMDLSTFIYKQQCECLNESDDHPFVNCLTSSGGFLESDCDEQVCCSKIYLDTVYLQSRKLVKETNTISTSDWDLSSDIIIIIIDNPYCESDALDRLIVSITFNQSVKIHSLKIKSPQDKGPKTIKLFINQPRTLDFDMADSYQAVQELVLTPEDLEGTPVNLRYVKFQNVQNIQLFIKDNQSGSETTRIDHLAFIGSPISTTNMSDFKRVAGKKGEGH